MSLPRRRTRTTSHVRFAGCASIRTRPPRWVGAVVSTPARASAPCRRPVWKSCCSTWLVSGELDALFAGFSEVRYERFVTPYDRRVGGPLAARMPRRFGWFVGITAKR